MDKVIEELMRQMKAEKEYNRPFKEARETVKRRQMDRETEYERFKRQQEKERVSDENLMEYLAKSK